MMGNVHYLNIMNLYYDILNLYSRFVFRDLRTARIKPADKMISAASHFGSVFSLSGLGGEYHYYAREKLIYQPSVKYRRGSNLSKLSTPGIPSSLSDCLRNDGVGVSGWQIAGIVGVSCSCVPLSCAWICPSTQATPITPPSRRPSILMSLFVTETPRRTEKSRVAELNTTRLTSHTSHWELQVNE